MREAIVAQCSAPPSEPAKSAFLRFNAMGRMARSTTLKSISILPSSRNRVRNCRRHRLSAATRGVRPSSSLAAWLPRFRWVVSRRGYASCKRHCGARSHNGATVCKVTRLSPREIHAPDPNDADAGPFSREKRMQ